ncbi:MAG: ATP-binding protein [Halobacteriaceae archaeon]
MDCVFGRRSGGGASGRLGRFLARDGSDGGSVGVDFERSHAALVVGKRGAGKSHTLGVLAAELAATDGVDPVVVDPMGSLAPADLPVSVPRVPARALPPRAWCGLLDLDPESAAGALLWRAASAAESLDGMRAFAADAAAADAARRAVCNHLDMAAGWDLFGPPDGASGTDVTGPGARVVDCSGLAPAPLSAACHAVATAAFERSANGGPRPWLLVDEAAVPARGVAREAIRRLFTRGRHADLSVVLATQRPGALPEVAASQADLVVAHRLSSGADVAALERARPAAFDGSLADRLPRRPGAALVVDDATERVARVSVRSRTAADRCE